MNNFAQRLRIIAKEEFYYGKQGYCEAGKTLNASANELSRLSCENERANARERKAFMAGVEAVQHGADFHDEEEAWQQYRCRDETDWKVVSEEDAAKIDASVLRAIRVLEEQK